MASIPVSFGAQPTRPEPLYRSIVTLAVATCKVMRWDLTVEGEHHIPRLGPAVIASNHIGALDFVFLGFAGHSRGRLVRFMAKQEAFDHWLAGPLLRGMRHIPVDRVGDPAAAYRRAIRALGDGEVVGIHPEGKINRTLVPTSGKTGAARMALATGAPLIPAAVWGSHRLISPRQGRGLMRKVTIAVQVGAPLVVEPGIEADDLTDRLMGRIRGLWSDAVRVERRSRNLGEPWDGARAPVAWQEGPKLVS
jgi:1-acyl-sn-glycerol-3-phosphate acyltransferase